MSIASIEDFLIATIKDKFQKSLREVDHLPGDWGADALRRMATNAPAVYVAYAGGAKDPKRERCELSNFHVYVFTSGGSDEKQRRRGDIRAAGAYQIVDILKWLLNRLDVGARDALEFQRTDNLFDDFLHANGLTAYRLQYQVSTETVDPDAASKLHDFLLAHIDYTNPPVDPAHPQLSDDVLIPQE